MSSDSETETNPLLKVIKTEEITSNSLPDKSHQKYETAYKNFMDWHTSKNFNSFSEKVLLAYFNELANKYKVSSLWTFYSMLRSTLSINNGVNIENFAKLRAFLKRKSEGYTAKKAKTFTPEQLNKFIAEAPDEKYLTTKVALIMGIMGSCNATELYSMQITDVEDLGSNLMVTVPNTKTKISRGFAITGNFYNTCKKYLDLRPSHITQTPLFYKFQNGRYCPQRIGINKFGSMGKEIATFLNLPNSSLYTGHCFRRSSATLLVDAGGDIISKRRSGWRSFSVVKESSSVGEETSRVAKESSSVGEETSSVAKESSSVGEETSSVAEESSSVAEEYMDESTDTENNIDSSIGPQPQPFASTSRYTQSTRNETITLHNSTPTMQITNCSHFTINFINKNDD